MYVIMYSEGDCYMYLNDMIQLFFGLYVIIDEVGVLVKLLVRCISYCDDKRIDFWFFVFEV